MKSDMQVAIAGAGLLGRLCAWRLAMQGVEVTLYEAGDFHLPLGACWTAAGMISPLSELVNAEHEVFLMGMQGLSIWPVWVAELEEQTGFPVSYHEDGSVLVAHSLDRAELDQFHSHLNRALSDMAQLDELKLFELGGRYSAADSNRWLNQSELQELEPDIANQFDRGLFVQPEAHVNSREFIQALYVALDNLGVKLVDHTAVQCKPNAILTQNGDRFSFDRVIDARGLGAKNQLQGLRGVRGEVMIVETQEVKLQRPVRLLHPRYKLYAVPRANDQIIIGATEIESEDLSPISIRSSLELSSALYTLNPAFAEARVLETSVNCRPAFSNNLPNVQVQSGLIQANGLFRHGYLLSPLVVGKVLAAIEKEEQDAA